MRNEQRSQVLRTEQLRMAANRMAYFAPDTFATRDAMLCGRLATWMPGACPSPPPPDHTFHPASHGDQAARLDKYRPPWSVREQAISCLPAPACGCHLLSLLAYLRASSLASHFLPRTSPVFSSRSLQCRCITSQDPRPVILGGRSQRTSTAASGSQELIDQGARGSASRRSRIPCPSVCLFEG